MGFIEKMKNLFTEEEDIVEPVKKEVMHVEIKAPTERREMINEQVNLEQVRKEEVKPAPVFFDDKDFAVLEKPKKEEVVTKRPIYNAKPEKHEKLNFSPSPIISPVYGILDKNYKKEDIVNKKESDLSLSYRSSRELTVDEVRQKAFGTLEDDIDLNLNTKPLIDTDLTDVASRDDASLEDDIFEEMETTNLNDPIINPFDNEDDITLGNVTDDNEEIAEIDNLVNDELNKENKNNEIDESDLFNLIDSMYEKRDEE